MHPDIEIENNSRGYIISKNNSNLAKIEILDATDIEITDSTYHDEFGISRLNKCLHVKAISPCKLKIRIELL